MLNYNSYLNKDCTDNFILNYNAVQSNMNKFKMVRLSVVPQYKKMSDHCLKHMNYKNIYQQLIDRSRKENRQKYQGIYYEEHHIIPKCIGGTNDPENLVLFTAREHFIAHWLLTKIYPNEPSIIFAFNSFSMKLGGATNHTGRLDEYSTSRNYERARIKVVELMKTEINPFREYNKKLFGTTYVNNGQISKRIKKDELPLYLTVGWNKGRLPFKRTPHSDETRLKQSMAHKGKKASKGSIDFFKNNKHYWVSKDGKSFQVFEKDLQKYLDDGWIRGRIEAHTKIWIYKNDVELMIQKDDLTQYLKLGYLKGRKRRNK